MAASELAMEGLPEVTLGASDLATLPSNQTSCLICLMDYEDGDTIKTLPCLHRFHSSCITRYVEVRLGLV